MKKRPIPVTIISWLLFAVGVFAMIAHFMDFKIQHPFQYDIVWIAIIEIIAIVTGAYLLLGRNWARWLAVLWMGFHVALSVTQLIPLIIHSSFLAAFAYFLFRKDAGEFFRPTTSA